MTPPAPRPRDAAPLPDAEARRRIREELEATLFVEAAAGTGKTTELVARVVALLRSGAGTLDNIVAVTFTEKAAGEMKLRLRSEIEKVRSDPGLSAQEAARFEQALEQLELARIGTIHAFCGDLLHERPIEAGVDPVFEVAPEEESRRMLDAAFEAWFQQVLSDPPEGVRRVLRRRPRGPDAPRPRELLRDAAASLLAHRDFPAPWRRDAFDREAAIDAAMERLAALGPLAGRATRSDDWLARSFQQIERFVEENRLREAVRGRDHDGLEAELRAFAARRNRHWRWTGGRRPYGRDLARDEALAQRDGAKAAIDALLEASDADLAPLLREELRPVIRSYETLKQRAGKLDFLDLLVCARDLIRTDAAVRASLQERFSHFFVDEFQDTDPLQAEILLLLAADDPRESDWTRTRPVPGKLFLVGDPKQAIYRFRRADLAVYEATRRMLTACGAEVVRLTTSFRATPALQAAVNAAFEPHMRPGEDGSQAAYVPLQPFRAESGDRPALVALPVPRPYGDYGKIVKFRIEQSLPDAVGAFVDWLVNASGWTVEEPGRPGDRVAVAARHVCILFRRFKSFGDDVTRPYVRALESRRVPHVLVGGRSFHEREEVLAIRNALCAIERPDDELRVFATLRGPLFALGDEALLAHRHRHGSLHPLRRLEAEGQDDAEREVAEALSVLARLHARRNHRPIAETLGRLLGAVRAHAGIAIWPTGEQALANCLRTVDVARRFERRGAPSFRSFVERMEEEAERGEAADAPVVEEGTEGVRIMTVHKAKGLEFPVVVLADPTCRAHRDQPSRHVDVARGSWAEPLCGCAPRELLEARPEELRRDAEEAVRLTYVAATRARDLLVVPVVGDATEDVPEDGWFDVLQPVVRPVHAERRTPSAAPGCPAFGDDSVLERPERAERGPGASVKPGLHRPRAGEHAVVWWDPRALDLDRQEEVGLRQQRILEADAGEVETGRGVRDHAQWQEARHQRLEAGAVPTLRVAAVTTLADALGSEAPGSDAARADAQDTEPVALEEVAVDRSTRPHGPRFGTLVHATLAAAPLGGDAAAVAAVASAQGRLLGAAADEVRAAAAAATAALSHPILQRAAGSAARGGLRRETPVLLQLSDGSLAEGVVDLAFRAEDEAAWIVVDFKTDRELGARRASYENQVRLYARAIAAATGEPARGMLLVV